MEIKEIVERINFFRNEIGISARILSSRINKSENYINRLEYLNFNPPISVLMDIINALEITPAEFFAEDYKNYKTKRNVLSLLEEIASNVSQDKIIKLLNSLKK